jgi:HK97 family phage major capsid protein
MYHDRKLLPDLGMPLDLERKEDSSETLMTEIKKAVANLGKDFEEFKSTNDSRIKEVEKKGSADVLLENKLKTIGDSMDKLTEAKSALEKRLDAEKKEREELELRLSRPGGAGAIVEAEKKVADFNKLMRSLRAEKSRTHTDVDHKGYEEYRKGFIDYMRFGDAQVEKKTMLVGSDPDGGYWVTPDITGQIVKKVYETSEMRAIASIQTISTDTLEGMEDLNEAGAGYAGEEAQGSDTTTPQVGKWRIPVWWIDTEPKATQQLLDDANVDVEAWLAAKVADKFARFENAEFVAATANKIRGFLGYTTSADSGSGVTWGQVGYVASGAAGAFASTNPVDKLYDLVGALKNAYQANARWAMKRLTIIAIRKFKDGQGNYIWQPAIAAGQPESLLGFPISRMEDMPTIAANSYSIAFGDFKAAYQIVDRTGIRVIRDNLTAKPYVKFYTTKRTGGGIVNFEAIKLMKFATS